MGNGSTGAPSGTAAPGIAGTGARPAAAEGRGEPAIPHEERFGEIGGIHAGDRVVREGVRSIRDAEGTAKAGVPGARLERPLVVAG